MQRRSALRCAMTYPMHNDLTNLLPPERQNALSRNYFLRLSVIIVWFMTSLMLISAVLLLPTYLLLTGSAGAKEAHLATINSALSASNGEALSARLAVLSDNAATLSALAHTPSASVVIRSVLALSRPGITLSSFSYVPADGTSPGTLAISGIALTRDALRSYQLALSGASFVHTADLPVSAYAKDSNIAFTITVTLAP